MNKFTPDNNPLHDVSQTGKIRPWRKHKLQSLAVSYAFRLIDYLQFLGNRIEGCGTFLEFKSCPNHHGKKLVYANFCKSSHCILCNARKSQIIYHQVLEVVHKHLELFPSDIPLMLTLTVPNCGGEDLREMIDRMSKGFRNLWKRKIVEKAIRGWFRALEVTRNEKEDTYHPHYHCLLMVPKNYFEKKYDLYIPRDTWLELWQEVMEDSSITQVDIRKIKKQKSGQEQARLVAEVAKYATKPSSYIKKISHDEYWTEPRIMEDFYRAFKGKRFIGFGGTFKKIRKDLKQADIETADLIQLKTQEEKACQCKICHSDMMEEIYTWKFGFKNYTGKKNIIQEIEEINHQKMIVSV